MTARVIFKRPALLYALATVFPFASLAEETVIVTAQPIDSAISPTQGYSAKTSAGATKTDQPLITTAQSVSVITRQQMNDQGANTISQALEYTPGVYSSFGGGATRFDTVSLRGYHGGDVDNLFLDGMRLMSDGGSHNVLQIDPWFVERVDVIRGPSSALYGQSVPGGVVNLTSKRPQFTSEGHFRLSGGTQNTKGAAFDYTDALNDQWAYRIIGMTRTSDTQYDNTREERYAISPSLLWQPDTDTSLLLRAYLQKDRRAAITARCRWTAPAMLTTDVSSPPAPTKAIRQTGISAASRSTATSSLISSMTSGPPTPPEAIPTPTYRWIRCIRSAGLMTAIVWRAVTAARAARWMPGQPTTACAPISPPANWPIR